MLNNYLCNCKKFNFIKKNFVYWEDRKTTSDEIDIINYIENNFIINKKNLLHIGIGNSDLAIRFKQAKKITGVTISNKEVKKAINLNFKNYKVFLCDKYSTNFFDIIKDFKFDFIIDANLKSYACCEKSFNYMFSNLIQVLSKDGIIITSINGMNWYKKLEPKLSFNFKKFFHYKLKETNGDISNILSVSELENISFLNNLKLTYNERVLYLKK